MNSNWSYSPDPPNLGKIPQFFYSCDLAIWRMTLKNNRAPLLCYFKLWAAFRSHWWIQTGVTVRKRPIWVKFDDFWSRVTLTFDVWPCTGTLTYQFFLKSIDLKVPNLIAPLSGYTGNNYLQELSYAPPRYRDKIKLSVGQVDFDKKFYASQPDFKNSKFCQTRKEIFQHIWSPVVIVT